MVLGIGLLVFAGFVIWLVFFKFRWLEWGIPWAIFSSLFVVHVLLIFFIGLRFVTPASNNAKVVQHTIQLVPRLTEPTSVTEVLVEENQHVHKGQPLFRFDRRPVPIQGQPTRSQVGRGETECVGAPGRCRRQPTEPREGEERTGLCAVSATARAGPGRQACRFGGGRPEVGRAVASERGRRQGSGGRNSSAPTCATTRRSAG